MLGMERICKLPHCESEKILLYVPRFVRHFEREERKDIETTPTELGIVKAVVASISHVCSFSVSPSPFQSTAHPEIRGAAGNVLVRESQTRLAGLSVQFVDNHLSRSDSSRTD